MPRCAEERQNESGVVTKEPNREDLRELDACTESRTSPCDPYSLSEALEKYRELMELLIYENDDILENEAATNCRTSRKSITQPPHLLQYCRFRRQGAYIKRFATAHRFV